jgi:cytochrome c peroxidase
LLHDMGDSLSNEGDYATHLLNSADDPRFRADASFPSGRDAFAGGPPSPAPASRREWRTPPLWGIRDSGPYPHDRRAETLEQAIAPNSSEALKIKSRDFQLNLDERICVQSFLKSLVAPELVNARPTRRSKYPILTSTMSE